MNAHLNIAHCALLHLHITQYTPAHYPLSIIHCTLHTEHCILHTTHFTLHTAHYTLHITQMHVRHVFILRTALHCTALHCTALHFTFRSQPLPPEEREGLHQVVHHLVEGLLGDAQVIFIGDQDPVVSLFNSASIWDKLS